MIGLTDSDRHQHRFGKRGRPVIHRRVRHLHPREFAHHRLEFEDGAKGPLADLGLIRRVRGEELATRNRRVHNRRRKVVVGAGSQETEFGCCRPHLRRHAFKKLRSLQFGHSRRQVERRQTQ